MKRLILPMVFLALAGALPAQTWTRPAKTPNTDVKCVGCPCATPTNPTSPNCSRDKLTPGYPAVLGTFVGRYLDSQDTNDFQQHFRTARARNVLVVPALNRLYFIIGSGLFAYDADRFFQRLAAGEALVTVKAVSVPWSQYDRLGTVEQILMFQQFFYAENEPNGWETQVTDGQDRLYYLDADDQGYVYLAYTLFGWGIVKDDLRADGSLMTSVYQYPASATTPDDVQPNVIAVVKTAGGRYFVLVADATTPTVNVFDAANRSAPVRQASLRGRSMVRFAKSADMTRIGLVTNDGHLEIYTADALVAGGAPLLSTLGPAGAPIRGVASDGTNFFAAADVVSGLTITTYAPDGPGYRKVADFPTTRPTMQTLNLRYADGYLVHSSITDAGYELRLFRASVNSVVELDLSIPSGSKAWKTYYPKNYYVSAAVAGFTAPKNGTILDSAVVSRASGKYFVVTAGGLGDVYQLDATGVAPPVVQPPTPPPVQPPMPPTPPPVVPPAPTCGTMVPGQTVFIVYGNQPGTCSQLGGSCAAGETVFFNASAFGYDLDCAVHRYAWNFGDGVGASIKNPSHVYAAAGTYRASLTISSPFQSVNTTSEVTVTGGAPAIQPPVVPPVQPPVQPPPQPCVPPVQPPVQPPTQPPVVPPVVPPVQPPVQPPTQPPVVPPVPPPTTGTCQEPKPENLYISYSGKDCWYLTGDVPCETGEGVVFTVGSLNFFLGCEAHSYRWAFGDGSTSTDPFVTHRFTAAGTYQAKLSVVTNGKEITLTRAVKVVNP